MKRTIYVGLPCYNEEKDINTLITRLLKVKDKVKKEFNYEVNLFCVNDGSTDNTEKIITKRKKDGIDLINHDKNKGLGGAMKTIINYFNKSGKKDDLLIVMDADNSHNPEYIIDLIKKQMDSHTDIVIASRYQKNATITGLKKYRIMISNMAKLWYTMMLRIPNTKDYTCGYRLYTHSIIDKGIKKYKDNIITQSSFACMMELLYKLYLSGASVSEIPFTLEYGKKVGQSKMKILKTTKDSLLTTIKIRKDNKKGSNNLLEYIIILLLATAIIGISCSRQSNVGIALDSAVYLNVARNILNGKILYTGIFDNKGPVLYFINALFLKIGGKTGIVVLEFMMLFTIFLYFYKTLKLINENRLERIVLLIFSGIILARFFNYGLSCEEYALCFSSIGLYHCIKYYKNDYFTKWQCILLGILCALCFFIRQNLITIFAGFAIGIAIRLIIKKQYKELFKYILYALIGFLVVTIPILIYLFKNNCFEAYIECTFLFNMSINKLGFFKSLYRIYLYIPISLLIILGYLIILIRNSIINRDTKDLGIIITIILTILFNVISSEIYLHYLISLIPLILLSYNRFFSFKFKHSKSYLIAGIILISILDFCRIIKFINVPQQNQFIINYIKEKTTIDDKIAVIGFYDEIYYLSERESISRYTYILKNDAFSKENQTKILNEYFTDIINGKPKIIIEYDDTITSGVEPYINISEYREFIYENYVQKTFVNRAKIYELKTTNDDENFIITIYS